MINEMKMARAMVMALSDGALLLDETLEHVCHNASYADLMALGRRVVAGIARADRFPRTLEDGEGQMEVHARACLSSGRVMRLAEQPVVNSRDERFTVNSTFVPVLGDDDTRVGVICIFRDVSAEVRLQERYRELLALDRARAKERERQIEARTQEVTLVLEEVTRLSRIDSLTGLLNRRAFNEHAEQALDLARRHKRVVAVLMCDLDRFKKLNDTYGHHAGDVALKLFAKGMGDCFRASDKLSRFGGEEFVVLLTETSVVAAAEVAARVAVMARALPLADEIPGFIGPLTVSIGVAIFPLHGDDIETLTLRADQALYAAKERGRDRVVVYEDSMSARATDAVAQQKQRVLLVDPDHLRGGRYAQALSETFAVTTTGAEASALDLCRLEPFDVVIADCTLSAGTGTEFLWKSLRLLPNALRVLIIETRDMFLQLRAAHLAQIDVLLLREDCGAHLLGAVEDGLDRRQLRRQQVLTNRGSTQQVYFTQLDELEALLEDAASKISFHYQPIVRAADRSVFAYEALCRVDHAVFRDPSALFEAAIQSGNIWKLSRLTRQRTLQTLGRLPPEVLVFANLHPTELDDPQLLEAPSGEGRLVFEVTERSAMPEGASFLKTIEVLRARGYRFAIDDLGAGYAGLNSVAMLGPDFLKIDISIIRDIHQYPRKAKLVNRIIDFANDEGIQVIAEGIESAEEAATLESLGCHLLQGYWLGRPAPLD